jgi:hypothetical protein
MLKKACLPLLLFCICLHLFAAPVTSPVKTEAVLNIFKIKDRNDREKKLISLIRSYFGYKPLNGLTEDKAQFNELLQQYHVDNIALYNYFIDAVVNQRTQHLTEAETALVKGIDLAGKTADHYFAHTLFSHLAFLQTYQGNTIDAVISFRKAKKEAITLNDPYLQVLVDINISDIYYRNNFYGQSISYLNQAQAIVNTHQVTKDTVMDHRIKNIIIYNKAENYFRMGNLDSLKKYNTILNDPKRQGYKLYNFRNRTNYYLSLLQHNYKAAINSIIALKSDSLYTFDDTDRQNLADAYYNANMPDSAKHIINGLLADDAQNNHPEVKLHLYKVLGNIALKQNDNKQAAYNFNMALQQSEDQINRLTQVGSVSSLIRMDELQGSYIHKEETLVRQRLYLIFIIIVSALAIAIGAMFYRNIKQKRYYEKLLFDTQKKELAFINSHEVRRHLSNILGIIDMIKHSENKPKEYLQAEEHLLAAAKNLDKAIQNISNKLDN